MKNRTLCWLVVAVGIIVYGMMTPAASVFATDQAIAAQVEAPQPQDQPVQPSEANPRYEPEQIAEPDQITPPPQVEEQQQANEPDEIEQAVPPLNQ